MTNVSSDEVVRWGDVFSLRLPLNWRWEEHEGVVSVFHPDGMGAISISIVTRTEKDVNPRVVSRQLAKSFLTQRAWNVDESEIRVAGTDSNAVSEFEFTELGDRPTYWQVWHIVGSQRAAFITYTSSPEDAKLEASQRRSIVQSFAWVRTLRE